jgi:hypothetical protein
MSLCAESGYDLGADERWRDLGDVVIPAGRQAGQGDPGSDAARNVRGVSSGDYDP